MHDGSCRFSLLVCWMGYQVTFEDLIKGLAILSQKASREQKLMLSFHLLDPEGTGYITKKMTTELLRSCLAESKGGMYRMPATASRLRACTHSIWLPAELDIYLSDEQIKQIVDFTFEEADLDRNNLVDLREYQVSRTQAACMPCHFANSCSTRVAR